MRGGGSWWRIALAGVCAGLLPYTYIPARFIPFLFLVFGLSFLLPLRAVTREFDGATSHLTGIAAAFNRVRAEMPRTVVFLVVAGLVAAPILVHFALHPEHFVSRSGPLWLFDPSNSQGDSLRALLVNVWDHLLAFGFRGDPTWRHNYAGRPMLNPVEALFFWLGVGLAVWRWQRRPAYRLLLIWLCILLLPAVLSRDYVPNTLRMIGAAPAVYLLIGVGMWEAFRFVEERFFRERGSGAAFAMGIVVGGLVLVQGVITYRTYFQKWAAAPETYKAYDVGWTELARMVNAQPSATDEVYLIPVHKWDSSYSWHYSFQYLYRGTTPTPMFFKAAPNPGLKIESTLGAMENMSTVKLVDWDNEIVGGGTVADKHILFLLGKYGRHLNSDAYTGFQIHTYTDIALERPWTYYDYLEPLTVHYDGGISLHGFAWGQGTEQLSSQQLNLGQERPLWIVLQWQVAPGQDIDFATSLRLRNAEGGSVYQQDAVLTNSKPASTSNWSAGELIDTLHLLEFSADLPPGEYEMRLVVYDFATLKPTVEIGVWESEYVLARLWMSEVQ